MASLIGDSSWDIGALMANRKLKREKVVAPGKTGVINLGPLEAGEYPFMGEYNAATAQGKDRFSAMVLAVLLSGICSRHLQRPRRRNCG